MLNKRKYEDELARLERQMQSIENEHTKKETERYIEDLEKRELEDEIKADLAKDKQKRIDRANQERKNNPARDLITDASDVDDNGNQGNNIVVTPPVKVTAETGAVNMRKNLKTKLNRTKAGREQQGGESPDLGDPQSDASSVNNTTSDNTAVQEESQQDQMGLRTMSGSQPTMIDFLFKRSSTLRDSITEDTEEENYESAAEDTPKAPRFTSTQTMPKTPIAQKLEFKTSNYELVPTTPAGAEGGTGDVTVKLDKLKTFADLKWTPGKKSLKGRTVKKNSVIPKTPARKSKLGMFNKPATPTSNRKRAGSGGKETSRGKVMRDGSPVENKAQHPAPKAQEQVPSAQQPAAQQAPEVTPEVVTDQQQGVDDEQQAVVEQPVEQSVEVPVEVQHEQQGEGEQGQGAAANETKEENESDKSDDLSSLSVLFCENEEDQSNKEEEASNNTLEETAIINDANVTIRQRDTNITAETDTTVETDTTQDTVIEVDQSDSQGAAGGIPKNKVIMVKEYDSDNNGSLDKPPTPPMDYSGHMVAVLGKTPAGTIDSSIENQSVMAKMSRPLVNVSSEMVVPPNTEQKKQQGSEVD